MPALEEFDLGYDDLPEVLGEPWPGVLWGCGFEDLLSRQYEDCNIVDLYLKRRGWSETEPNRDYFAALRDTCPKGIRQAIAAYGFTFSGG